MFVPARGPDRQEKILLEWLKERFLEIAAKLDADTGITDNDYTAAVTAAFEEIGV